MYIQIHIQVIFCSISRADASRKYMSAAADLPPTHHSLFPVRLPHWIDQHYRLLPRSLSAICRKVCVFLCVTYVWFLSVSLWHFLLITRLHPQSGQRHCVWEMTYNSQYIMTTHLQQSACGLFTTAVENTKHSEGGWLIDRQKGGNQRWSERFKRD